MNQNSFLLKAIILAGILASSLTIFFNTQKKIEPPIITEKIAKVETKKIEQSSSISSAIELVRTSSYTTNKSKKQYTNQFYPGLQINYPEDWNITYLNSNSNLAGLLDGGIELTKNGTKGEQKFKLLVRPLLDSELQKSDYSKMQDKKIESIDITDQFRRVAYSKDGFGYQPRLTKFKEKDQEEFLVMTNIGSWYIKQLNPDKAQELNKMYNDQKYNTIHYLVRMEYQGDVTTWGEADEIVRGSKFIFSPLDEIIWNQK
jgi:hypothetical protein